jgi:hypothetical protein
VKPDARFLKQGKDFWAHVRTLSQAVGYTEKKQSTIKIPSIDRIIEALRALTLKTDHLVDAKGVPTPFARLLIDYFIHRANVLNTFVEPRLMNADAARSLFQEVRKRCKPPDRILPLNKQKGKKKTRAYLTGLVNMMIYERSSVESCEYDPRVLTTITRDGKPLRTLARRVDGAFPTLVNPIAIWEIKEYYHTTTFGSRVADGVYETLLDGMELEELREHEGIDVKHYLMLDSHFTWWECGRSYLCRIIDMLHMGYVDEVLFGREVVERMPEIVDEWVRQHQSQTPRQGK